MSQLKCPKCQDNYDGEVYPECPSCLGMRWVNTPGFVKKKHDPYQLPFPMPCFRSVLSPEVVDNLQDFLGSAAKMGTWYYSHKHQKYCHVTAVPCYLIPGSAIPEGDPLPDGALDGLMIANANSDPHAYCVDIAEFQAEVAAGEYQILPHCSQRDCSNIAKPGSDKCWQHQNPG
jgi:hypothetical protein